MNPSKTVGPKSIPTNILKLLNDEISSHLSNICNMSFSMGVFPSVLKTAKVIPVHKEPKAGLQKLPSNISFTKYQQNFRKIGI